MKKLSIIIPVYNEEQLIASTLELVCSSDTLDLKKEIIVVDDGSKDQTKKNIETSLRQLRKKHPSIIFNSIYKKINQGKGAAVKNGFMAFSPDFFLISTSNFQYNPHNHTNN